jgi:hypothetical protein
MRDGSGPRITKTEAFKRLGVRPKNIRWSWSGRSDDGKVVGVTFWEDLLKREGERLVYEVAGYRPDVRTRPGFSELMDNLSWARDKCGGRIRFMIVKAEDIRAEPRRGVSHSPSDIVMKVTHLDTDTGAFRAEGPVRS